jgi:hypothetical protein
MSARSTVVLWQNNADKRMCAKGRRASREDDAVELSLVRENEARLALSRFALAGKKHGTICRGWRAASRFMQLRLISAGQLPEAVTTPRKQGEPYCLRLGHRFSWRVL